MPGLFTLFALGAVSFWLALMVWTYRAFTRPPRRGYAWAVAKNRPSDPGELAQPAAFTEWMFDTGRLKLPVWDIKGRDTLGPVIVVTPGWGQARVGCLDRVAGVLAVASRVVVWEMPAMGDAPGRCSLGAKEPALLGMLLDQLQADRPIVLFGISLGAGVSIVVGAARDDIAGVIAEAPYRVPLTPALGVLRAANLPRVLNLRPTLALIGLLNGMGVRWRGFDRAEHASRLRCPLLVLQGELDDISPLEDAKAIAEAAKYSTLIVSEGIDHHTLWQQPEALERNIDAVRDWLQTLAQPVQTPTVG